MNSNVAGASNAESRQRKYLTVIMIGSLLVFPGCGIPKLRRAQSGPTMPHYFSFNNGATFWNNDSASSTDAATDSYDSLINADGEDLSSDETSPQSKGFFSPIRLASLVKRTSPPEQNEDDAPIQISDTIDDSIEDENTNDLAADLVTVATSLPVPPAPAPVSDNLDMGTTSFENSAQLTRGAFFDDPFLIDLIYQSLAGNQELKILAEEIQITRNEVQSRSGEYLPFVRLGGGAGLEKSSRFSRDGAVEDQLQAAPGRGFPEPLPDFLVATTVSWELDIWKKLRNARDAATMRYLGTREGRNYIVTRLVAEVAENYYELLALDNRLITLQKTIEIQEKSLEISKKKKDAGRGTELAVQRFQGEVRKNQSEITIIQQEIVEVENRINLLVGRYPQPVGRASVEFIDLNLNTLNAGMPSQLLQNRADIRQAERQVAAAGLDVKVARARFYPSLGLQAGVGLNAYNMRYLFATPESLIYNTALDLVGPLINKRAIRADYCSANAAQLQSIYNYQRTILTAHIEVVNYMTKVENYRQSIETKKQQLAALEASVDTAGKLFQNARAEYVEVLLAQRELMEAKMLLIETKQEQLGAVINTYQALGGGGF